MRPEFCDVLERIAQVANPEARVWRGSGLLAAQIGIRVLGTEPRQVLDVVQTNFFQTQHTDGRITQDPRGDGHSPLHGRKPEQRCSCP